MNEYRYKIINDAIYGCIGLSKVETDLINTRAMQRLRRIRQMGFSSYVFPSCEHSRFIHSLGVLYIMGEMCNSLFLKGELTIEEVKKLRVAALLHDVGHYPFSHLTESVYSFIKQEDDCNRIINNNNHLDNISLLSKIANVKKEKKVDHEHLGAEVIKNDKEILAILEKESIDPEEIGRIITGEVSTGKNDLCYVQLMHSSLDADRMDYLLRDSNQAGVVFGSVEYKYIIENLRIVPFKIDGNNTPNSNVIAVNKKAQHAVEHFLTSRYFHYCQTIYHRVSLGVEAAAKLLLYKFITKSNKPFYYSYDNLVKIIGKEDFYSFTDDFFWSKLNDFINEESNNIINASWNILNKRKVPKNILYIKDIVLKGTSITKEQDVNSPKFFLIDRIIERNQKEIAEASGLDLNQFGFVKTSVSIESLPSYLRIEDLIKMTEENIRSSIKIVDKDNIVRCLALDTTSLINKMVDYELKLIDFFVIGEVSDKQIELIRKKIDDLVK